LYEPVPTLAVGLKLKVLLEARGATVVMTRTTPDPVALGDRPIIARRAGAHALVSVHLNALPDGINPFLNNGTGTYFFHPQAEQLARSAARHGGSDKAARSRDQLRQRRSAADVDPSILCEGIPHVAWAGGGLRTDTFRAHAWGI
jgi:N-acetylmuramoyl-L-alanine amidase